jgi:hypothetical protein
MRLNLVRRYFYWYFTCVMCGCLVKVRKMHARGKMCLSRRVRVCEVYLHASGYGNCDTAREKSDCCETMKWLWCITMSS